MMWAGLIIAGVLAFIGGTLIYDGDNPMTRIMGLVITLIAGIVLGFSVPLPGWLGYHKLDHAQCAQYEWVAGEWTCIPWEQGG